MYKGHSYQEYRTWYFIMGAGGLIFLLGFIILVFGRAYTVDYTNHDLFLVFGVCFMVPGVVVVAVSAVRLCQFYHSDNSRLGGINTSISTQPLQPPSPEHRPRVTQPPPQSQPQFANQQQQQLEREMQQQQYQQKYQPKRQQQPSHYPPQQHYQQQQQQQMYTQQQKQQHQQQMYTQQQQRQQQMYVQQQQHQGYQPSSYQQQRPSMPLPRPPPESQQCSPGYSNRAGTSREPHLRY